MYDPTNVVWRKSSFSNGVAECVEVAATADAVLVRDSKDRSGPVLTFTAAEWAAFTQSVRSGEFDR